MKRRNGKRTKDIEVPPAYDWRTTDEDEVNRRKLRARTEQFRIRNLEPSHPVYSRFRVDSATGRSYSVEIRDIEAHQFVCDCVDFRTNGLGTCKHVEAVLLHLEARLKRLFRSAIENGPERIDVVPDHSRGTLRLLGNRKKAPRWVRAWIDPQGFLCDRSPDEFIERLRQNGSSEIRISQEIEPWLEARRRAEERRALRHEYEMRVQSGEWPAHETLVPLFPYQREGMLHLAFTERALLADEMGLGKTIQAIAACALLHRLGKAARVLIVAPASLKSEWEEQIQRFTRLNLQLVYGSRHTRLACYRQDAPSSRSPTMSRW